jgi:energy-coupling factor transporter ATP-binding protein EcfA2
MSSSSSFTGTRGAIRMRSVDVSFGSGTSAVAAVTTSTSTWDLVSSWRCLARPAAANRLFSGPWPALRHIQPVKSSWAAIQFRRPSAERGVVFQHHTLFPWKTVLGNIEFGLKMRGLPKPERQQRARKMLQRVGLADFEGHYPEQLPAECSNGSTSLACWSTARLSYLWMNLLAHSTPKLAWRCNRCCSISRRSSG